MFDDLFDNFKKSTSSMKYCIIIPLVMAVLYFIAAADVDYGYYTFVKIMSLVFLGIFIIAYGMATDSFFNFPVISSMVLVILFNPIVPISFDKDTWTVFDIIAGLAMLSVSAYTAFCALPDSLNATSSASTSLDEKPQTSSTYAPSTPKHSPSPSKPHSTDEFIKEASAFLGEWERQKSEYTQLVNEFNEKFLYTVEGIQAKIKAVLQAKENGLIKKSPIAQIDFSYYVFFNLYLILCQSGNKQFVYLFNDLFEAEIIDAFENDVPDSDFFEKLFDNRSKEYDRIMREQGHSTDAFMHQISQFIAKDLWSDDCFSKELFLIGFDKRFELNAEISELYTKVLKELYPSISALDDLYKMYSSMNDYIKDLTGHDLEFFSSEQ